MSYALPVVLALMFVLIIAMFYFVAHMLTTLCDVINELICRIKKLEHRLELDVRPDPLDEFAFDFSPDED